jgi:Protein of unknown function (DUF3383)
MGNRYVKVTVTRETKPVSQAGFGLPLILATSKTQNYKTYSDLSAIAADFAESTEEYKLAAALLGQSPRPDKVAIYGTVYDGATGNPTDLTTALNTLIKTHNDWYYLVCPEQGDDEILALAEWVKTQDKFYFASTSNKDLDGLNHENVFILVHNEPEKYPAEALVGNIAPREIGSYTVTFKTLNGINPATYDTAEIDAIHEKNFATYIREGGVNIVSAGKTTSGEYVDVVQSTHYIKARMTENVFGLLTRSPKVPFTDAGIAQVVAEVERTLKDAFLNGIIAEEDGVPMFTVTAPTRAEVPPNDRANRHLPDVKWTATIAGAVEDVDIAGVLQI